MTVFQYLQEGVQLIRYVFVFQGKGRMPGPTLLLKKAAESNKERGERSEKNCALESLQKAKRND